MHIIALAIVLVAVILAVPFIMTYKQR